MVPSFAETYLRLIVGELLLSVVFLVILAAWCIVNREERK